MSSVKLRSVAFVASLAVSAVVALTPLPVTPTYMPGAYLVEFEDSDAGKFPSNCVSIVARVWRTIVNTHIQDAFYKNLTGCNITAQPRLDLNHELFKGASFSVGHEHDDEITIGLIQSFSIVKQIWPIRVVNKPTSPIILPAENRYTPSTAQSAHRKRGIKDSYGPHVMGGVDKLHDKNFTGKGVFIGIVDTGVDFMHPAFRGGFGPGFKVIAGEDLVGDGYVNGGIPVRGGKPVSNRFLFEG